MRILLADDRAQVRSALRLLLEQEAGLAVVAEADGSETLLEQLGASRPDLILLDWELPGNERGGLVRGLKDRHTGIVIVALSSRPEARPAALSAGADYFICKGDPPEELFGVLRGERGEG